MSSLRHIKKRINNVAGIEKITQSMKSISTSRLSNAKNNRNNNKDYFETSKYVLEMLFHLQKEDKIINPIMSMLFSKKDKYKKTLMIIISSDRGLCGSYNSNVFKMLSKQMIDLGMENFLVMPVGGQSKIFCNKIDSQNIVPITFSSDIRKNIDQDVLGAVEYVSSLVLKGTIDSITFISTKSLSILAQEVYMDNIFPVSYEEAKDIKVKDISEEIKKNIVTDTKNISEISVELLKQYLFFIFYDKISESAISEHASRLNAMTGANDNSKELKRALNLEYNRTRQGIITKELIEIISGAEAV